MFESGDASVMVLIEMQEERSCAWMGCWGGGVKCLFQPAVQPAKAMTAAATLGRWSLRLRGLGRALPSVFFSFNKYEVLRVCLCLESLQAITSLELPFLFWE